MKVFKATVFCLISSFFTAAYSLDLNQASAFELEATRGIGEKMAQDIVSNRKENGFFMSWIDFKKRIKGVGDKNLLKIKDDGLTLNTQTDE